MKKIIIGIISFIALCASAWGVTEIFVLKPVYKVEIAGLSQQIIEIQKNNRIQRAEDRLFYWERKERELIERCENNDAGACQQLVNVRRSREEAERRLWELKNQ